LVQIGWLCCDAGGETTDSAQFIIKPRGFKISARAAQVHGISTSRALREGTDIEPVLDKFAAAVNDSRVVVAHNLDFDETIVQAEFIRANMADAFQSKRRCCTMKETADFCRLPGKYGYKWPTLTELHRKLFQEDFEGAHGALADTQACKRCFYRLRELGFLG
jgi:DNA polymerase III epsilon subunit-like protein